MRSCRERGVVGCWRSTRLVPVTDLPCPVLLLEYVQWKHLAGTDLWRYLQTVKGSLSILRLHGSEHLLGYSLKPPQAYILPEEQSILISRALDVYRILFIVFSSL